MATSKNLKIRECDLDEALIRVIYGYKEALQRDFVNLVNSALERLEENKQDKSEMVHYFNKDTEKIQKSDIDPSYTENLDTRIDALVPYEKLEKGLRDRIARYEDNATTAISRADNMQTEINGLKAFKSSADNEINKIWIQLTGLDDRMIALTGGSGSSSSSSSQLNMIIDDLDNLTARVNKLASQMGDVSVNNITMSQLSPSLVSYMNDIKMKAENAAAPKLKISNAQAGMIAIIGGKEKATGIDEDGNTYFVKDEDGNQVYESGILKAGYILLAGRIAKTDSEISSLVSAKANWIFCIAKDQILVSKSEIHESTGPDDDSINAFYKECVTNDYNDNYYRISNAFTESWMANNKFIYDQVSGELYFASDGDVIKVVDPKEMGDIKTELKAFDEDIKALKNFNTEITNIKSDISDIKTRLEKLEKKK